MTVDEALKVIDLLPDDKISKEDAKKLIKMVNNGFYLDSSISETPRRK